MKLTEDEKVFVAMSFFNADAPLCFVAVARHADPRRTDHAGEPRRRRRHHGPRWSPARRSATGQIDALAKFGALKGKLGIVGIADEEESQLDGVVLPALKRNKISEYVGDHRRALQ